MKRRGRPPHPDVLTPRQWEVLALIREGLTDREIAARLGISLDGVKFHVSEILGKLGVTSRNEAARWHEERLASPTACLAGTRSLRPNFSTSVRTTIPSPRRGQGPAERSPWRGVRYRCRHHRRARLAA
jgi:DNA-binding CsgD family transcriptional regulator